ncbi:patatin-like phospholipase family protein [Bifidobacterium choerinum]|uniref:Patatin-like phospholipase n=1 Tax=Bifidobacterium choerinum TaxID=35760 RepID=A0A087AH79_9BIFI|nr:patatin family protein [Bifidobacterium choerinum]KFI58129.1 patatin-like phospholipase [Bifidobacterium choerinum]
MSSSSSAAITAARPKIGVIDVGGGLRSAYGAGVLDWCLDHDVRFDYGLGVSAGAANVTSYLAGQRGRAFRFYADYSSRPAYMGVGNLLRTGSFLGLDYIYGTLMNASGEDPLDYDALTCGGVPYRITVTNALSGTPEYFGPEHMRQDDYDALKATACLPVIDRPYVIDGVPYFDGTISDPIPVRQAFADGCDKVVVILTRPRDFRRKASHDAGSSTLLRLRYPKAARALAHRAPSYNEELDLVERLARAGKACIVAPQSIDGMSTLTRDADAIGRLYRMGLADGATIADFLAA